MACLRSDRPRGEGEGCPRAATLVEDHVHPSLDREDWRQVERWIGLLPAEVLNRPRLLVAQAWLHYIRYQFPAIVTLLDAAENAMATSRRNPSERNNAPGRNQHLAGRYCLQPKRRSSMVRLPKPQCSNFGLRCSMPWARRISFTLRPAGDGQYAAAVEFAHRQLDEAFGRQANSLAMRLLLALSSIHYEMAELPALQAVPTTLQQLAHHRWD